MYKLTFRSMKTENIINPCSKVPLLTKENTKRTSNLAEWTLNLRNIRIKNIIYISRNLHIMKISHKDAMSSHLHWWLTMKPVEDWNKSPLINFFRISLNQQKMAFCSSKTTPNMLNLILLNILNQIIINKTIKKININREKKARPK